MKKILFIPAQFYPIPAVQGGAVEVLLTQLIEENEVFHQADFYVVSKYNEAAANYKYEYTKIKYIQNNLFLKFRFFIKKFFRKLLFNRITKLFFKKSKFGFKELTYFGYVCDLIGKKVKPDIIVSESYDKIHQLWPLLKRFGSSNFYYHLHYTKEENIEIRKMFPNTIAISNFVLNHWVKDKALEGKNHVLLNGIDLEPFSKEINNHDFEHIRKELNLDKDDFVVLFSGRLRPHKGIYELLQAFNKIHNKKIKLLLAGDFLSESKEHNYDESQFEENCFKIIRKNKNIIRTGNVSYEKIPDLYCVSDIQVIPSMWEEGAGLVAIEGMASGLPLIITNSGGMPEYTGDKCAIILDRDEKLIDNIQLSILKLFNDSKLRESMCSFGKERSLQFSKENYYKQYMHILLNERNENDE